MSSSETSPAPPPLHSDVPSERLKRSKRAPACGQHPWHDVPGRLVGEPLGCVTGNNSLLGAVRHATTGRNTDGGRDFMSTWASPNTRWRGSVGEHSSALRTQVAVACVRDAPRDRVDVAKKCVGTDLAPRHTAPQAARGLPARCWTEVPPWGLVVILRTTAACPGRRMTVGASARIRRPPAVSIAVFTTLIVPPKVAWRRAARRRVGGGTVRM